MLRNLIFFSRPYFELKARFNQILDDQKRQVQVIEETIAMTKEGYSDSLKELEKISEEIHQRRAERQKTCQKNNVKIREQGVGAENPATPTISTKKEKGKVVFKVRRKAIFTTTTAQTILSLINLKVVVAKCVVRLSEHTSLCLVGLRQVCCDHDGDETDGFRLNVKLDKTEEDEVSLF